jgi:signal transduction histidine kinase
VFSVSLRRWASLLVRRVGRRRSELFDILVAGLTAFLTVDPPGAVRWPVLIAAVVFAALWVRRRWPLLAVVGGCVALFAEANSLAVVVGVYTLASRRGPTVSTWTGVLAVVITLLTAAHIDWATEWPFVSLTAVVILAIPLLAGLWRFQRAKLLELLRDRAGRARRERALLAQRAVAAERRRIAGEMHDVVAHRVGVIAVQSGALALHSDDKRVEKAAEVIRRNSLAALSELGDVVGVLRDGDSGTESSPGLGDLRRLVEDARSVGAQIDLRLQEPLPEVPVAVGRAAYRVVQEALTNAGKHAPGARVAVSVSMAGDELVVEVTNTRPTSPRSALPGSGYGLVGMRERVALAGGEVDTGPQDDDGYRVRATFPGSGAEINDSARK